MRIVIFSDLHYAPERPINNGSIIDRKLMEYAEPLLDKLIIKVNNEIKPDLVLNLGDLIEDFNDKQIDLKNLAYIWNKFKAFKPPFYSLAGNHDLRAMDSRTDVERVMGYDHSTYSFDLNGYHFVMLGLDVQNDGSHISGGILKTQFVSKVDLEWLKKDLKINKLPTLIFVHFGVAEDEMVGNWWFSKCNEHALLANRKELKQIIKQNKNVIAVFSGHQHWTKTTIEDNLPYFVIGSMTENINDDGVPDGIYFDVELNDKTISVKENHLRL